MEEKDVRYLNKVVLTRDNFIKALRNPEVLTFIIEIENASMYKVEKIEEFIEDIETHNYGNAVYVDDAEFKAVSLSKVLEEHGIIHEFVAVPLAEDKDNE